MDNNFDGMLDLTLREILTRALRTEEVEAKLTEIRGMLTIEPPAPVPLPRPGYQPPAANREPPPVLKRTKAKAKQLPCKDCGTTDSVILYNRCKPCRERHKNRNGPSQSDPIDRNAPVTQAWIIEFKARVSADPKFAAHPGVAETLRQVNAGVKPLFKHLPSVVQDIKPSKILASTERK